MSDGEHDLAYMIRIQRIAVDLKGTEVTTIEPWLWMKIPYNLQQQTEHLIVATDTIAEYDKVTEELV